MNIRETVLEEYRRCFDVLCATHWWVSVSVIFMFLARSSANCGFDLSLAHFIHRPSIHLSANSSLAYSPHNGLLRFLMRHHYPIRPSLINVHPPSSPQSRPQQRTSTGAPSSSRCTVASDSTSVPPSSSLSRTQIAHSVYNLQSMLTTQHQFNGYVFNVVRFPSCYFKLLFEIPMRAEELNLRYHRGGEAGAPRL